jgi:hypothetical protein
VALRAAHHPGFDRVVLEVAGDDAPAASVRYVRTLVQDGSGRTLAMPGRAILRIELRDARAHDDAGEATVRLTRKFGLPVVLATRNAGDFEGIVTMGVGLTRTAAFEVHRLGNPGRVVVDISTRTAPPRGSCVYLVKGLRYDGIYTGGFVVARVRDGRLTGTTGDFYSEWAAIRGTVSATRTRLQVRTEDGTWQAWPQRWLPTQRRLAGWTMATRAQLRTWSGGGVPLPGQPCD